jgi:soluble lytic murein transglycosylase
MDWLDRLSLISDEPTNSPEYLTQPQLHVYIYQRIGDIGLRTGLYTDTVAAYQAGIDVTEDTGFQTQFREKIAEAELLLNQNPDAAIAQYEQILDIATIDSERARILRLLGEAYLAMEDTESAYKQYLEAVDRYPEAYDSYLALVELVNADVPVDEFQRGLVDYHAEAYVPAIAAFERYLAQQAPSKASVATADDLSGQVRSPITSTRQLTPTLIEASPTPPIQPADLNYAAEATWLMALSTKAIGQYSGANLIFQNFIDSFPQSPNWGEAHLEIGNTYIILGNSDRAKTFLRDFVQRNPNNPVADEALWRAAQLELSDDLFEEASASLRQVADDYPTSEYAVDALYWAGQSAYKLEDYEQAIENWTELTDNYPTSDLVSYGGYWQARALTELDRETEAEAILTEISESPLDYYVLRTRDLITGQQPTSIPLKIPIKSELAVEQVQAESWLRQRLDLDRNRSLSLDRSDLQNDQSFLRGDTLLELGLRDEALVEFETVKDTWWNDALAMYQLSNYFKDRQLGRLSILTAARLISLSAIDSPEEAPVYIQRLYYPIYFADLIFDEAAGMDLDPALLVALIRQESLFEQSAHSHAGARGLTQVMPGTGEYVAERSGAEDFNIDQLWLPFISIRFGSWYISQQLDIFDDNQFAALAAYNAGPGNVLEWIKTSDDLDIFVESIPFWESRVYIRTIYVNLAAYRSLYGVPPTDELPEQNKPLSDE